MKITAALFFIFLLKITSAQASFLFSASNSLPSTCGPYPYKQLDNGTVLYLPILSQQSVSQGYKILDEENRLFNFLHGWTTFFVNNGDDKLRFNILCYGFYNDEISTGPNALAFGKNALLIGTKMMKLIRDDIDQIIAKKMNEWNPGQQIYVRGIKSTAALEFLLLHEFGHHLQNMHGYTFSGVNSKMQELHADCVGASLFTLSKIVHNQFTADDAFAGMLYAYALGDGNVQSKDHHGFPEERSQAFSQGMANMINLRNTGWDLTKFNSKQVIESCRAYYR